MKGIVKKTSDVTEEDGIPRSLVVFRYSAGDYFPLTNLMEPVKFNLITECPSEIITVPKKVLKKFGYELKQNSDENSRDNNYYKDELKKQADWKSFKHSLMKNVMKDIHNKKVKERVL